MRIGKSIVNIGFSILWFQAPTGSLGIPCRKRRLPYSTKFVEEGYWVYYMYFEMFAKTILEESDI